MIKHTCIGLALASVLAAAASAQTREPQALVGAFYAEPNLALPPDRAGLYLARDLAAALRFDPANPGRLAALDFDFRYGAPAVEVSGLQLLQEVDNDQAKVVAVFKNAGHPESVNWTLCRGGDGEWRIANADSNTGRAAWDLRAMLRLPADRTRC